MRLKRRIPADKTPAPRSGRMGRVRALRLGAAGLVVLAAIGLGASPASAHTSLVSSTPADRSVLPQAPGKISLGFANAVDPRLVSIGVVDTAGAHHPGARRLTPDRPDTKSVEFSLPALRSGTYGVTWQSIGPDGHRVSGEVVFGVGVGQRQRVASARFSTSNLSDHVFEVTGGVGRFVWYAGLSLVVGALYGLWWLARTRDRAGPAEQALDHVARRVLSVGAFVTLAGVAIRWATTVAV